MTSNYDAYEDVIFNRLVAGQTTSDYLLAKYTTIFDWEGLPLTIPKRVLETMLTEHGFAVVYEHEGELFVTNKAPSGNADIYGEQRNLEFDHQHLGVVEHIKRVIGIDAVLIRNDPRKVGLLPHATEHTILSAQSKISLLRLQTTLRTPYVFQAKDKNAYDAALEYERAIRRGDVSVILAREFDEHRGIEIHATPTSVNLAEQAISLARYIEARYWGELGIDVDADAKSQYVNKDQTNQSHAGAPLLLAMLQSREEGVRDCNALFGTNLTVKVAREWQKTEEVTSEEPASDGEAAGAGDTGAGEAPQEAQPEGTGPEGTGPEGNVPEQPEEEVNESSAEEVAKAVVVEATEAVLTEEVTDA